LDDGRRLEDPLGPGGTGVAAKVGDTDVDERLERGVLFQDLRIRESSTERYSREYVC
jgi:hypothetical protein